jgi:hypothetical protein
MTKEKQAVKVRKPVPEWKKEVDRTLWSYSRVNYALAYHETLINEIEMLSSVENSEHNLQKDPETVQSSEQLSLALKKAKLRQEILLKKKETIEKILDWVFPKGTEKRKFVEAYWLSYAGGEARIRSSLVFSVLPFLGESTEDGSVHGNRNFYYWRNKIYYELAEGFGYLPEQIL